MNMGAWFFVDPLLEDLMGEIGMNAGRPIYAGRAEAASPATGLARRHQDEQAKLVDNALTIPAAGAAVRRKPSRKKASQDAKA